MTKIQKNKNIKEEDKILFYPVDRLKKTAGIEARATDDFVRTELQKRFPEEIFRKLKVTVNESGEYQEKATPFEKIWGSGKKITGLPAYVEVELYHSTGDYEEQLVVWSPFAWNDRFAGTAGGGTGIGGRNYLTRPKNTQRGWTVPLAVRNGFTAATMYAGNIEGWNDHTIDPKTGELRRELYENWRLRSTHNMTVFGKAIAEILHDRPVRYAYMNGGSGGGRQSLMEVQKFPEDYDGVWASCPAINWNQFLLAGYWPEVVMHETGHFLTAEKNTFFLDKIHEANGGKETYYRLEQIPAFDCRDCIGMKTKSGKGITEDDARVMNEIIRGPHKPDGSRLWYGFYPGVKNWQEIIPIGTYYYSLANRFRSPEKKHVTPFILGPLYIRWITEKPGQKFDNLTWEAYVRLFEAGNRKFADANGNDPAIDAFAAHGGKLMIDHGMDDPLIPTEGTIDYFRRLCDHFGGQDKVDEFVRLYITPGDNHGNCWGNGPGISERDGMIALMNWVEKGIAPEEIPTIQVKNKSGELVRRGKQKPFRLKNSQVYKQQIREKENE